MKVAYLGMTNYGGPAPGFEVWPAASVYCDPEVASQSMKRTIDLCLHAEALGFDWISVSEHHYAPYMLTPNPIVMAGALSQVIKRAKIALLGPLVPLNNPVRLAEEIAMLDSLTDGRVVVLFLRGTPNELHAYNTPLEDTRGMTQEGIDLVIKAWTERQPFAWNGKHYQFKTISVWPRPRQVPYPALYGSGNSEESVAYAAKRRIGIAFSFAPPDVVKKWVDVYKAEAAKEGWTPTPEQVLYRGIAYVAATDSLADEHMAAYFGAKAEEQSQLQSATMGGPPMLPLVVKPYFLGSPETVKAQFAALRDVGVGVVDMGFNICTHEQQVAALDLFAAKVLPTIRAF